MGDRVEHEKNISIHECKLESENDEHVTRFNVILNMNKELNSIKMPEYRKLYDGKPNEQLEISIIFNSNMKILENNKEEVFSHTSSVRTGFTAAIMGMKVLQ